MKAIWKGSIGFGLVNIPVKLFSAINVIHPDFDMLDRNSGTRIRFKRVNEETGKEVEWENIVKGYFYKGRYVVLEDEDFEDAAPKQTKLIEIKEFVDVNDIAPIYFETAYYIEPEKNGYKAYGLFREALEKSGRVGVATFVLRHAEILAVLKPYGAVIVLHKIRFPEEIRGVKEFDLPSKTEVKPGELKVAIALIKQFSTTFKASKYKDEYSKELMRIIQLKAAGKRAKVKKLPVVQTKNADLMKQLKASLTSKKRAS